MNKTKKSTRKNKTTSRNKIGQNVPKQSGQKYDHGSEVVNLSKYVIQPYALTIRQRQAVDAVLYSAATTSQSRSWNMNGLYDFDPRVGGQSVKGFNQWMGLYNQYQVISVRLSGEFCNLETQPMHVFIVAHSNAISDNSVTKESTGWRFSKYVGLLSAKGGMDRLKFSMDVDLEDLLGNQNYWGTVNNYQGTSITNPATSMQFAVGCQTTTGVMAGGGVICGFSCEFNTLYSNATEPS
jgi:hypothetical protein